MSNIITVCSSQGGNAKTTSAVNIAAALQKKGYSSVVVDTCHVGEASHYCENIHYSYLGDIIPEDRRTAPDLSLEQFIDACELIPTNQRQRFASEIQRLASMYDYVIIDTNAMESPIFELVYTVSDYIVIPARCDGMMIHMISGTCSRLSSMAELNSNVKILGAFVTMFDRNEYTDKILSDCQNQLNSAGIHMFDAKIYKSINVPKAQVAGTPIVSYKPKCRASRQYLALTDEIITLTQTPKESI